MIMRVKMSLIRKTIQILADNPKIKVNSLKMNCRTCIIEKYKDSQKEDKFDHNKFLVTDKYHKILESTLFYDGEEVVNFNLILSCTECGSISGMTIKVEDHDINDINGILDNEDGE